MPSPCGPLPTSPNSGSHYTQPLLIEEFYVFEACFNVFFFLNRILASDINTDDRLLRRARRQGFGRRGRTPDSYRDYRSVRCSPNLILRLENDGKEALVIPL